MAIALFENPIESIYNDDNKKQDILHMTISNNKELLTRGVSDVVPLQLAEEKLKSEKPLRLYLGIDPTGALLHVGHSVPLLKLRDFQNAGHHVIFLIGSFTAMVGDPTGRDKLREPLTREQVIANFETYKEQASKILDFSKLELRYNHEWLEKLSFAEIMQLASHFTVQQMMERDMFKERMSWKALCIHCNQTFNSPIQFKDEESFKNADLKGNTAQCPHCGKMTPCNRENISPPANPISPNEFLYPLMQGYDSVILDVDFEVGGNDQLFNMLCGRKLQKAYDKREKFVLTTKLIEGTDGRKMSKSFNNCIYFNDSANEMYRKVMEVKDELILPYFECCTRVSNDVIDTTKKRLEAGENPRDIKMTLAREIVTMYHSKEAAESAEKEFIQIFQKRDIPSEIENVELTEQEFNDGKIGICDLIVRAKFADSKSKAKQLIEGKAVSIDDEKITNFKEIVALTDTQKLLKVGSRKFAYVPASRK